MNNIYQHFRKEEQDFIDQVIDWVAQVDSQYTPYLSKFLNPREIFIVESIVAQYEEIQFQKFGGHKEAEQQRFLIYPSYFMPTIEDFEISLFEIDYPSQFVTLTHGQILGSILGTGISRQNLGDIITDGNRWQFFVDKKMKDFIILNLENVGRTNVKLISFSLNDHIITRDKWELKEIIVSSLRLDVILSRSLNLSRNQTKKLISNKKIKINWMETQKSNIELQEYDILSIRGYGRIQIRQQKNRTRKDNLVLEIGIIDRNT